MAGEITKRTVSGISGAAGAGSESAPLGSSADRDRRDAGGSNLSFRQWRKRGHGQLFFYKAFNRFNVKSLVRRGKRNSVA